jgi:magnesium-transporting ATPase (P-type)
VAAGFLTAILSLWIQNELRFFYEEEKLDREELTEAKKLKQKNIESRLSNRRISSTLWCSWLYAGVLFALVAFGLTGLDWLMPHQADRIEQIAKGLLVGAFDITLIAVLKTIIIDYRAVAWAKEGNEQEPLPYGLDDATRTHNKRCLFIAMFVALILILASSILLAIIPPDYWAWLILSFFVIPLLIVGGTYCKIRGAKR